MFEDACLGGGTIKKSMEMIFIKVKIVTGRDRRKSQVQVAIYFLTLVVITWLVFCDKLSSCTCLFLELFSVLYFTTKKVLKCVRIPRYLSHNLILII